MSSYNFHTLYSSFPGSQQKRCQRHHPYHKPFQKHNRPQCSPTIQHDQAKKVSQQNYDPNSVKPQLYESGIEKLWLPVRAESLVDNFVQLNSRLEVFTLNFYARIP